MTAYVNEYGRNLDVITPVRVAAYESFPKESPYSLAQTPAPSSIR